MAFLAGPVLNKYRIVKTNRLGELSFIVSTKYFFVFKKQWDVLLLLFLFFNQEEVNRIDERRERNGINCSEIWGNICW